MDVNKMISEFQSINDKLVTYENERTDLQIFIKNMLKENQKLDDKIKKESDTLLKEYYRIKIITNNFYINKLIKVHKIIPIIVGNTKDKNVKYLLLVSL